MIDCFDINLLVGKRDPETDNGTAVVVGEVYSLAHFASVDSEKKSSIFLTIFIFGIVAFLMSAILDLLNALVIRLQQHLEDFFGFVTIWF